MHVFSGFNPLSVSLYFLIAQIFELDAFHVLQVAANHYRPDLKKAALARLSAVNRSIKVAKSGVKKRNRQAVKIRGRK